MCFSSKSNQKTEAPAAAPAPALEPATVPEVGDTRRKESEEIWGSEAPNYRVARKQTGPVNKNNPITM